MWFSLLCNEEKEEVAREYEQDRKDYYRCNDPSDCSDCDRYRSLLEVKEDIEYYIENTRADYFAYLEQNGLTHLGIK
jgi:hypothetical protein